jgi:hypothetical protein
MRSIAKQDAIRRARIKLIKISMFQNKAFASKRPEMRDRRLASKANEDINDSATIIPSIEILGPIT